MTLQAGALVWIPCEVVRGAFPDERNVRVDAPDGPWAGFVDAKLLRDDITTGRTAVRATIVAVSERTVSARLPGQTPHSGHLTCPASWIQDVAGG
jgi:hypothetical protein